jgi:omega-hydroxypalmitate O-feruloyl transferase
MGIMMSHTVFDGPGAIDFFLNFTSIARGEGLLFEPSMDRTPLKARNPPIVKYEHPENFELPPEMPEVDQDLSPFTIPDEMDKEFEELKNVATHITKVFPFTPEAIDTLKKRALEGGVIKRVSTFEVVAAHIWLARTKSVDLPEQPFNLLFAVDIRNRVIPPLPKHFAGNAVYSACARGTPSQIRKYTFVEAVGVIQKAIEQITDDYVRSSFDWGETRRGVPALFGGFFLSAWWKMPFYSIDYGWGKPIYAGPIVTPMVEFVFLLSNGKQDGGLNLVMALEPDQMEKFQEFIKI